MARHQEQQRPAQQSILVKSGEPKQSEKVPEVSKPATAKKKAANSTEAHCLENSIAEPPSVPSTKKSSDAAHRQVIRALPTPPQESPREVPVAPTKRLGVPSKLDKESESPPVRGARTPNTRARKLTYSKMQDEEEEVSTNIFGQNLTIDARRTIFMWRALRHRQRRAASQT